MDNVSHIIFDNGRMDVKQGVQAGPEDMEIQNRYTSSTSGKIHNLAQFRSRKNICVRIKVVKYLGFTITGNL